MTFEKNIYYTYYTVEPYRIYCTYNKDIIIYINSSYIYIAVLK